MATSLKDKFELLKSKYNNNFLELDSVDDLRPNNNEKVLLVEYEGVDVLMRCKNDVAIFSFPEDVDSLAKEELQGFLETRLWENGFKQVFTLKENQNLLLNQDNELDLSAIKEIETAQGRNNRENVLSIASLKDGTQKFFLNDAGEKNATIVKQPRKYLKQQAEFKKLQKLESLQKENSSTEELFKSLQEKHPDKAFSIAKSINEIDDNIIKGKENFILTKYKDDFIGFRNDGVNPECNVIVGDGFTPEYFDEISQYRKIHNILVVGDANFVEAPDLALIENGISSIADNTLNEKHLEGKLFEAKYSPKVAIENYGLGTKVEIDLQEAEKQIKPKQERTYLAFSSELVHNGGSNKTQSKTKTFVANLNKKLEEKGLEGQITNETCFSKYNDETEIFEMQYPELNTGYEGIRLVQFSSPNHQFGLAIDEKNQMVYMLDNGGLENEHLKQLKNHFKSKNFKADYVKVNYTIPQAMYEGPCVNMAESLAVKFKNRMEAQAEINEEQDVRKVLQEIKDGARVDVAKAMVEVVALGGNGYAVEVKNPVNVR